MNKYDIYALLLQLMFFVSVLLMTIVLSVLTIVLTVLEILGFVPYYILTKRAIYTDINVEAAVDAIYDKIEPIHSMLRMAKFSAILERQKK